MCVPALTATMKARRGNKLVNLQKQVRKFQTAEYNARLSAARTATMESRRAFDNRKNKRVGNVPDRPGRTGGPLTGAVKWLPRRDSALIMVNAKELDAKSPYWVIQEIGTGKKATISSVNPTGQGLARSSKVRTVKSQKGRRIPGSLVFADGAGKWAIPGSATNQQLYRRSKVRGVPQWQTQRLVIRREIKPAHFVQSGGTKGFRAYRTSVRAAARRAFRNGS